MKKIPVVFDFDGVIVDSLDWHVEQINSIFPSIKLSVEEFQRMHDGNLTHERDTLPNSRAEEIKNKICWGTYNENTDELFPFESILYEGVKEGLEEISDQGHPIWINSSSTNAKIRGALHYHGLEHLIPNENLFGVCVERLKTKKFQQILQGSKGAIFVTDTTGDICEAKEYGIDHTAAVTYGYHSKDELNSLDPESLHSSFPDLVQGLINPKYGN